MNTELFSRDGTQRTPNAIADGKPVFTYIDTCNRCGGAGGADKWQHTGWRCFDCGGSGKGATQKLKLYTAEKIAALNAAADKRNAIKAEKIAAKQEQIEAERAARRQQFMTVNADFIARLQSLCGIGGDFWNTLYTDMMARAVDPSPRQVEIVDAEISRRVAKAASVCIGNIGERVTFHISTEKVIDITFRQGTNGYAPYGSRYMFLARDAAGNRIIYKGNGDFPNEGESAIIKATVIEHAEYKGEAQTIINRPKMIEAVQS